MKNTLPDGSAVFQLRDETQHELHIVRRVGAAGQDLVPELDNTLVDDLAERESRVDQLFGVRQVPSSRDAGGEVDPRELESVQFVCFAVQFVLQTQVTAVVVDWSLLQLREPLVVLERTIPWTSVGGVHLEMWHQQFNY